MKKDLVKTALGYRCFLFIEEIEVTDLEDREKCEGTYIQRGTQLFINANVAITKLHLKNSINPTAGAAGIGR